MLRHLRFASISTCGGILAAATLSFGSDAYGQANVELRSSVLIESYSLSGSLAESVDRVSELSVPVTATVALARRVTLTVAGGYAKVSAEDRGQEVSVGSGMLDTEVRLALQAVRDRLTIFATSGFPTGIGPLDLNNVSALGVLTSDVIGFSSPNLGGVGTAGGGIALSLPAGTMAAGMAVSYRASGTYQPFLGTPGEAPNEFRPGGELRLRLGLEGPVARRSFFRVSGIFAHRGEDEANGEPVASVGNRLSGYASLDQGIGTTTLSFYAFDQYRSAAGLTDTPVGPSIVQRGNIFAAGAQWSIPLSAQSSLAPRLELRDSRSETDDPADGLVQLGRTTRFGVDLRQRIGQGSAVLVRGDRLVGSVFDFDGNGGTELDVSGYRLSILLEMLR